MFQHSFTRGLARITTAALSMACLFGTAQAAGRDTRDCQRHQRIRPNRRQRPDRRLPAGVPAGAHRRRPGSGGAAADARRDRPAGGRGAAQAKARRPGRELSATPRHASVTETIILTSSKSAVQNELFTASVAPEMIGSHSAVAQCALSPVAAGQSGLPPDHVCNDRKDVIVLCAKPHGSILIRSDIAVCAPFAIRQPVG
jgi:hypothetical protein